MQSPGQYHPDWSSQNEISRVSWGEITAPGRTAAGTYDKSGRGPIETDRIGENLCTWSISGTSEMEGNPPPAKPHQTRAAPETATDGGLNCLRPSGPQQPPSTRTSSSDVKLTRWQRESGSSFLKCTFGRFNMSSSVDFRRRDFALWASSLRHIIGRSGLPHAERQNLVDVWSRGYRLRSQVTRPELTFDVNAGAAIMSIGRLRVVTIGT